MNCSVCFLVIFLGAFTFSSTEDTSSMLGTIRVVDDDDSFLADNPGVNMTKMNSLKDFYAIVYSYGERKLKNRPDHILDVLYDYTSWVSPHKGEALIKYSCNPNVAAVITMVLVIVEQTSYEGDAFIVKGGIGEKNISIVVYANNTYFFSYVAIIYGIYGSIM